MMTDLTMKQHDIAETITQNFDYIEKLPAIRFIQRTFGKTARFQDIIKAYDSIEWGSRRDVNE